jgi:D-alanine-D-alanine ligase
LKVGLAYNLIPEALLKEGPIDSIAELDTGETIATLRRALESGGHQVYLLDANSGFFERLKSLRNEIDIVFNIAEGLVGEIRESQVPIFCEVLRIPYTGSGPLTLGLCLNKARAKEIMQSHHILTPKFQVIDTAQAPIDKKLRYPLIVKLNEDGSSKGLAYDSVVSDERALRKKAAYLLRTYGAKLLVEEYIAGREFTVPIIGNDPPIVLPIIEIIYNKVPPNQPQITLFVPDESVLKIYEELHRSVPNRELNHTTICPAILDRNLERKIKRMAIKAYQALGCRDWCRLELRLDNQGRLYLLELNPIAGIDPSYHFPHSAREYGLDYEALINRILDSAIKRYQLLQ